VAGLVADLHEIDAALDRGGDQPRSKAMAAERRRIESKSRCASFDDGGDIARRQAPVFEPLGAC
jgi:hypothetical protein